MKLLRLSTVLTFGISCLVSCERPKPKPFAVTAASCELADVQAAVNAAKDGDTIQLPACTATWTARLEITKGITLQGATTVNGAGTANPVVDPKTTILDDTDVGLLRLYPAPDKTLRITGIAFQKGTRSTSTKWSVIINPPYATGPSKGIRIDHCSFDQLETSVVIGNDGWSYPLIDHNVIDYKGGYPFLTDQNNYNGKTNGNGAWNDFAWFGTDNFFFIETNTIRNMGTAIKACLDTTNGSRTVFRYNYVKNGLPADHGTEGQEARYDRCREIYNNEFNFVGLTPTNISARGGTLLLHDNLSSGLKNSNNVLCNIGNYRANSGRSESVWGQADGTSVWDENDTEGNGTFVEGHAPFVHESGTATGGNAGGQMTDTTKNWPVDKWVGYSIQDTASAIPHLAANITANTSNTITYSYYGGTDTKRHLVFTPGVTYKIHRCLRQLDMSGTGKGDLVSGAPPINTTTGKASYPHYLVEPSFAWNNKHEGGVPQIMKQQHSWMMPNRDFYDLGIGFTGTPQKVKDILTAAINGVQYTAPFTYPHPLASGGPVPSPSVTASPTATQSPTVTPPTVATSTPAATPTPNATASPQSSPLRPTVLSAKAISSTEIDLSWTDNSNNETGFEIERKTDSTSFSRIVVVGANVTVYPDTGVTGGTKYYYRARSYNDIGNSNYSNTGIATTSGTPNQTPAETPTPASTETPAATATPTLSPTPTPTETPESTLPPTPTPTETPGSTAAPSPTPEPPTPTPIGSPTILILRPGDQIMIVVPNPTP